MHELQLVARRLVENGCRLSTSELLLVLAGVTLATYAIILVTGRR